MADMESVAEARKKVAEVYNDWLKESFETKLSEMGSTKTRDALPAIGERGSWAKPGIQGKPLAWIVLFSRRNGAWTASLPPSNHPQRIGGSFNARSPLQGVLTRVLPVVQTDTGPIEPHPYWEWALAFVFAGKPASRQHGSSGTTINYNPGTGELWATTDAGLIPEPYVQSGLFRLVPADERWSGDVDMTYGQATDALAQILSVAHATPSPIADDEDEAE